MLEEDDNLFSADIYINPPENYINSDEDSGDEEFATINNLSRHQLLSGAELRVTRSSQAETDSESEVDEEDVPVGKASTSKTPPPKKKRKAGEEPSASTSSTKFTQRYKKPKDIVRNWKNEDIAEKIVPQANPPKFVEDLENPIQFFELFFDDIVIELLRSETEKNGIQKGRHDFRVTTVELKHFLAILLLSGYNSVSRYRMYWEQSIDCSFPGVAGLMSRNRFDDLLRFFHVADNSFLDPSDRFTKVRPLWNLMNERWVKYYPGDTVLSIDESMIPYYGKHGAKQHIHGKPIRFGYKNWSICTRLGYLIHGELYQGASTGNTHPEIGVGGSVVLDLVSKLPNRSYSLYFDNFFTSLPLLEKLQELGHDGTGTIRANRVANAPLPSPKDMKKTKRGSFEQLTETKSNITLVRYNDNSIVTVASTQCGTRPVGKVKRYCDKERKEVDQPRCIINYNKYMGGVDRLDQNISCYRVGIRLKRWYWQLLMFPINASMNNAFQLYKISPLARCKTSTQHDLLSFTRYVVASYMLMKENLGRTPKAKVPTSSLAVIRRIPEAIRLDGKDHLISKQGKQTRCGHCHKNTTMKCIKCRVALHQKCFVIFHSK